MNYRIVCNILGKVLLAEALLLLLPMGTALLYHESALPFLYTILPLLALGGGLNAVKARTSDFFAREGFVTVGLSWILMSAFGALPFVFSGDIPHYIDALFETISGFTTTGASILQNVELLTRSGLHRRHPPHFRGPLYPHHARRGARTRSEQAGAPGQKDRAHPVHDLFFADGH